MIEKSLHIGSLWTGADEPKSVIELYVSAKSIFTEANINLRKWRCNNREVNESIEGKHESIEELSEDRIYTWLMLDPNQESENNVLAKSRNTK